MYSETAPRDKEFVILDEEDATAKYDAAPGKDHLRRGPTFSFFLSRAAAQPATASDVIGSRSVALAPVTVAVGAQTTLVEARASQARWRFAASLIAASLVVAATGIYYRGEVAYEAMIRKAAEAKTAELAQERDHAAALANELATIRRDFDTTAALSSKAADEVAELRNAVETKTAELAQERDHAAALANRAPAAAAPVAAPARKLDPDEVATLMDRAKRLIAAGDISPARLLLERAADAQESTAALMLALTYDPDVLETQNSRNIIPDPTMARVWYQRAAQLGSAEAQRRLSQLQN
jgi:TPR repeat protein